MGRGAGAPVRHFRWTEDPDTPTYVILTRVSPEGVRPPHTLEGLERKVTSAYSAPMLRRYQAAEAADYATKRDAIVRFISVRRLKR